jgi:hypothetical protein
MAIFGGHKASVKVSPFLGQAGCKMRSPFHAFKPLGCALCATAPRGLCPTWYLTYTLTLA